MNWNVGCCCCHCGVYTVGFWGAYSQSVWQVDFPATWTKLVSRNEFNLGSCNVLVIGRYDFGSPWSAQPTTGGECAAVASWITGGGVLFVISEYYGSPSIVPVAPITALNSSLASIGTQARAVASVGPSPNVTDSAIGTYNTSISHPLLNCVKKLYVAAPGFMSLGTSTLLFEVRKSPSTAYANVISIESFGSGFVVFLSDFSAVNNTTGVGNDIEQFLCNLGNISTN